MAFALTAVWRADLENTEVKQEQLEAIKARCEVALDEPYTPREARQDIGELVAEVERLRQGLVCIAGGMYDYGGVRHLRIAAAAIFRNEPVPTGLG